jgi:mannose-6-phosphate isomerase-like protein (cupin superfamily)
MSIIRADQAPTFELPGVKFTAYAAPSRGSAELCTWQITVAPDQEPTAHTLDRDETFLVLEGRLRVTPDGEDLGPGDVALAPAGETIAVLNPGPVPARAYVAIGAGFIATTHDGQTIQPPWAQ